MDTWNFVISFPLLLYMFSNFHNKVFKNPNSAGKQRCHSQTKNVKCETSESRGDQKRSQRTGNHRLSHQKASCQSSLKKKESGEVCPLRVMYFQNLLAWVGTITILSLHLALFSPHLNRTADRKRPRMFSKETGPNEVKAWENRIGTKPSAGTRKQRSSL